MQLVFTTDWTAPTGTTYPAGTVTSLDYDTATDAVRSGAARRYTEHADDPQPVNTTKEP